MPSSSQNPWETGSHLNSTIRNSLESGGPRMLLAWSVQYNIVIHFLSLFHCIPVPSPMLIPTFIILLSFHLFIYSTSCKARPMTPATPAHSAAKGLVLGFGLLVRILFILFGKKEKNTSVLLHENRVWSILQNNQQEAAVVDDSFERESAEKIVVFVKQPKTSSQVRGHTVSEYMCHAHKPPFLFLAPALSIDPNTILHKSLPLQKLSQSPKPCKWTKHGRFEDLRWNCNDMSLALSRRPDWWCRSCKMLQHGSLHECPPSAAFAELSRGGILSNAAKPRICSSGKHWKHQKSITINNRPYL